MASYLHALRITSLSALATSLSALAGDGLPGCVTGFDAAAAEACGTGDLAPTSLLQTAVHMRRGMPVLVATVNETIEPNAGTSSIDDMLAVSDPLLPVPNKATMQALPHLVEIAPRVNMPLMNLGNWNSSSNFSLWLETGGRGLDTAYVYGGRAMNLTGEAVRNSGVPRSEIFVTSKIPCTGRGFIADPETHITQSLDVMGLDYVDLMLMHWTCSTGPSATAKVWKVMESMITNGTARAIGVSNFNAKDIDRLLEVATIKPAVNQCRFSVGYHDDDTLQRCRELGITYSAYSTLGGMSTYSAYSALIDDIDVIHNPVVVEVAQAHGRSAAEVALRWVVQQGVVAISATNSESHMRSDLSLFDDFELSDDEMHRLSAVESTVNQSGWGRGR